MFFPVTDCLFHPPPTFLVARFDLPAPELFVFQLPLAGHFGDRLPLQFRPLRVEWRRRGEFFDRDRDVYRHQLTLLDPLHELGPGARHGDDMTARRHRQFRQPTRVRRELVRGILADDDVVRHGHGRLLLRIVPAGRAITNAAGTTFKDLPALKLLAVSKTKFGDSGAAQLKELKELKSLEAVNTDLSVAGAMALESAVPGIKVRR
jgi:hypothetical protein